MKWEVSLFGLHDHGETKSISFSTSILIEIVEGHCRLLWVWPKFPPFVFLPTLVAIVDVLSYES